MGSTVNIFIIALISCQVSGYIIPKNDTNLSKQNGELLTDMRWFFGGVQALCEVAEDMLPKINETATTRQFSESNKLNFVVNAREFFGGLKEISRALQETFSEEHLKQLEQLKVATYFLHEQLSYLRTWLGNFRAWITQLFRLYDYYVPEVLFGKCVSKYMRNMHPDSAIYEYPLLLLNDIINYYLQIIEEPWSSKLNANETISMQQNEILHTEEEQESVAKILPNATGVENYFSLREYFQIDKNSSVQTWQKCFKMYTIESLARQLKLYLIEF